MHLALHPIRFTFVALEPVWFAEGKAANALRGALGLILRETTCLKECPSVLACPGGRTCAYAQLFAPLQVEGGPSGLHHRPRPFVLRASHLGGQRFPAGRRFSFDLHLFDTRESTLSSLVGAFQQLRRTGLGPHRSKVELVHVTRSDAASAEGTPALVGPGRPDGLWTEPLCLSLETAPEDAAVSSIRIRFLTPTELKHGGQIVSVPSFDILIGRIRDRVFNLSQYYGPAASSVDLQSFAADALQVQMRETHLRPVSVVRKSSRTGQVHPLGGFVGSVEYQGPLSRYMPWLRVAYWTGVGRQTVWGKGVMEIDVLQQ
jgi:hypothetical protein